MIIIVITDHFLRFSFLITLKRATGKVVAGVLRLLFCTLGSCKVLLSDNGPQMVSRAVCEICVLWGVKRAYTTPYHTQTNWVERVNRNIVSMLCCFVDKDHTQWDQHVSEFKFAFKHDSTGFTAGELFIGRKLMGPGEWLEHRGQSRSNDEERTRMFTLVRERLHLKSKRNSSKYDPRRGRLL